MKYGQGPPPAGGWKAKMLDPDYSPAYQDEYQRLWHEAAAGRDRLREALEKIAECAESCVDVEDTTLREEWVSEVARAALGEDA